MHRFLLSLACVSVLVGPYLHTRADEPEKAVPPAGEPQAKSLSVETARDRAKLLQHVYISTLHVMHRKYFHGDRAMVPARVMEGVFKDMQRETKSEARWIAVNLKPMSINHEAKSAFERQAVKEIKSGKREVEAVEDGYYRRAVAISLAGGCMSCHDGFFRPQSTSAKFAGLVINIPLEQ